MYVTASESKSRISSTGRSLRGRGRAPERLSGARGNAPSFAATECLIPAACALQGITLLRSPAEKACEEVHSILK